MHFCSFNHGQQYWKVRLQRAVAFASFVSETQLLDTANRLLSSQLLKCTRYSVIFPRWNWAQTTQSKLWELMDCERKVNALNVLSSHYHTLFPTIGEYILCSQWRQKFVKRKNFTWLLVTTLCIKNSLVQNTYLDPSQFIWNLETFWKPQIYGQGDSFERPTLN